MTACPSEDELVRMVEGALADASLAAIEAHVDGCEQCASVIASLGALGKAAQPRVVGGRYELDRRIAAGGMGEVWAAWDPQLRREIAVKLVRPDRADDGKERERLLREARALARLTHPNVLAVHDVGESDGEVFLATELVAGDTLASRGGASADWRMLVRLYAQAARGLAAAHAAGLVHRDVKPANLLLGADGRVRVADFGLAIRAHTPSPVAPTETPSMDSAASVTGAGFVAGTPAYMAPEQRLGEAVDAPADQYALCVALGEAIAGRRPTIDMDRAALIAFVGERRTREPALDKLCGVIARGLCHEPTDRYPTIAALADELDVIVAPRDPAAESAATSATELARLPSPRPRGTTAATVAIVVAGIAAVAGAATLWFVLRAGPGAPDAPADKVAIASPGTSPTPLGSTTPTGAGTTPGGAATTPGGTTPGGAATTPNAGATTPNGAGTTANGAATNGGAASSPTGTATSPGGTATSPDGTAISPGGATTTPAGTATTPGGAATTPRSGSAPQLGPPGTASGSASAAPIDSAKLFATAEAAIKRHDGKACRAAVTALPARMPRASQQPRLEITRAMCEMVAGNCAGGTQMARDAYALLGARPEAAEAAADLFCPLTNDPAVRMRRLIAQTNQYAFDCDAYVQPARAAAGAAHGDGERLSVGTVMVAIGKCLSHATRCDEAEAILAEAQQLIPGLNPTSELTSQCR